MYIHSRKLTWNLKMDLWKTIFLYNPVVFRFHVNLPECSFHRDLQGGDLGQSTTC